MERFYVPEQIQIFFDQLGKQIPDGGLADTVAILPLRQLPQGNKVFVTENIFAMTERLQQRDRFQTETPAVRQNLRKLLFAQGIGMDAGCDRFKADFVFQFPQDRIVSHGGNACELTADLFFCQHQKIEVKMKNPLHYTKLPWLWKEFFPLSRSIPST